MFKDLEVYECMYEKLLQSLQKELCKTYSIHGAYFSQQWLRVKTESLTEEIFRVAKVVISQTSVACT